jgi:hypothetical protein
VTRAWETLELVSGSNGVSDKVVQCAVIQACLNASSITMTLVTREMLGLRSTRHGDCLAEAEERKGAFEKAIAIPDDKYRSV